MNKIYENAVYATIQLVDHSNIHITHSTVDEFLHNHPDYPSLLSISDSLMQWHINSVAIKVETEKLADLPLPFIACTKNEDFITIIEKNEDGLTYINDAGKKIVHNLEEFIKNWNGVVLLAEATPQSGEKDFIKKRNLEKIQNLKIPGLFLFLFVIAAFALINSGESLHRTSTTIAFSTLLFLNIIGIFISCLLLGYEMDKTNPALQKICTGGAKINCNAILNSKEAKIFSWLSWSEVGFFYFTGSFIALALNPANLLLLTWFNAGSLLYVFYSVYYQWRVAKQWCPMCLSVQSVLFLGFLISSFDGLLVKPLLTPNEIFIFLLSFAFPVIGWYLVKPLLQKNKAAKQDMRELKRFKYNSEIFETLLLKKKLDVETPASLGILLGNIEAKNSLIKVCSPYCGPCARAHPEIEKLIEENSNLSVQIIFNATNNENDIRKMPVKHFLAIDALNDKQKTKQALDEWYLAKEKDYAGFAKLYPLNGELKMQDHKIEAMETWCKAAEIKHTPTFYLNGYRLPDLYNIKDVQYFLDE